MFAVGAFVGLQLVQVVGVFAFVGAAVAVVVTGAASGSAPRPMLSFVLLNLSEEVPFKPLVLIMFFSISVTG